MSSLLNMFIAYQNKNHTFNWLNTLHVTFTIPRYRLECWYRPVQKPCINWYYIANSSWHWGSYGSIWIGPSPKQYYMDRSYMAVYGPVRHQKNIIWTEASEVYIIFFWWRIGPCTAIWPEVTWTICYIILFI
jgi:hypothetical protein